MLFYSFPQKNRSSGNVLQTVSGIDICHPTIDNIPDFCLVDVTQENFIAGKNLAGKKLGDITVNSLR